MTILVFGGSSQIGHFLLPRLQVRSESVLAISRQPPPDAPDGSHGVHWRRGHLPDAVSALPADLSAIVCFGPLLPFAHWLAAAAPPGAPLVIATSSMSAQSKQASAVGAERAVAQELRQGETRLAQACDRLGCAWTVLRPTLIYGAGRDHSLTPIARRAMRWRMFPLPAGRGLRQPVHADDIAQVVLAVLDGQGAAGRVLEIGGGERLSAAAMFARVQRSLPVATVPLPLPAWLLRLGAQAAPRLRGPLARLDTDLLADNHALQHLLGIHPRPFRPDPACWRGS